MGEMGYFSAREKTQEREAIRRERRAHRLYGDPKGCDSCHGLGWVHIETDAGREVESCDCCDCLSDPLREERAIQKHRIQCGCNWPENASDHPYYQGRTMMPIATFDAPWALIEREEP
jgi:hypothetical protein